MREDSLKGQTVSSRRPKRRPVVAVLTAYLDRSDGGYEYVLRRSFSRACRRHDFDLVVLCGEAIDDPRPEKLAQNRLYQLIDHNHIDGIIVLAPGLASYCGLGRLNRFLARFQGIKMCSLGAQLDGIPSVVSDNQLGMRELVEHVIVRHSRRQLAFLGTYTDNVEVDERREVFLSVCESHAIEIRPERLMMAGLEAVSAQAVATKLLQYDDEVDAIVAANDSSGIGVLRAIEQRGLRVPEQIIVTGYDDIPTAGLLARPLSTVRQPIAALADVAVDIIAYQLSGSPVAYLTKLPTEVILRASCGCESGSRNGHSVSAQARPAVDGFSLLLAKSKKELKENFSTWVDSVEPTVALDEAVLSLCHDGATKGAQSTVETELAVAEPTFPASHVPGIYKRLVERINIENMYVQILETASRFARSIDLSELELNLASCLPTIHSRDVYMALFTEDALPRLRRALRLENGRVSDSTGELLLQNGEILTELSSVDQPRTQVVLAIAMRDRMLGVIGFHELDKYFDYLLLRDHVTSALHVVRLHDEVLLQTMTSERNAQERQAAAERTRSLSALAGGVAHDLNNSLGSLVALSDVVRDEIDGHMSNGTALSPDLLDDLSVMKSGALRAAETVKDLMTLGRIGRTRQEPFDIARLTRRLVEELRDVGQSNLGKLVQFNIDAKFGDLVVVGSEAHVERAIGNLLRNAIEAATIGGTVDVSVEGLDLTEPSTGYESIPAGSYAVVAVEDHGAGIAQDKLSRVFEPFFSTKRLGETSGSGLGLAIVHSVAKEHRGYVDVESLPGEGSRFALYLPRTSAVPGPRHASVPAVSGVARILVVDDDLTQLRTAKRVLTRLGYDVMTTASGTHALDIVTTEANGVKAQPAPNSTLGSGFDLVIMDLALNEEDDGLTVFRKIREVVPTQKGILASGHAFLDHEEQIRDANLIWLPKPYTVESLGDAIVRALRLGGAPP